MSSERQVLVYPNSYTLTSAVAARFISRARTVLKEQDEVTVVLTGGRMGSAVLSEINALPTRDTVDWRRVNVWWGDERWLPHGDVERNDHQAAMALLDHVDLAPERVHPFPSSDEGIELDEAAERYAAELAQAAPEGRLFPRLDILFLGVGSDGHIASLFPERQGIRVTETTVIPVRNSPKPPLERLSLTLPVITSAHRVWLTLSGSDKASALGLALAGANVNEVPAAGACGAQETIFFVDQAAAAEVPANLITPEG